jgi:hypothetical protein
MSVLIAAAARHRGPSVAAAAGKASFSTSFTGTENPLSESGAWTEGTIMSAGAGTKTACQKSTGGFGTMVSFDGTNFTDSCAALSQTFGPDQEVLCTLGNVSAPNGLETEILLRADITTAHIFTYELDCVLSGGGISLVRWDMTVANPNTFLVLRAHPPLEVAFNDGDQVYGSIVGTLITCKYKAGAGALTTLFTYDTAGDTTKYSTGKPGVGFWNETGSAGNQNKLTWKNFLANEL